jgi:hypothetical protein
MSTPYEPSFLKYLPEDVRAELTEYLGPLPGADYATDDPRTNDPTTLRDALRLAVAERDGLRSLLKKSEERVEGIREQRDTLIHERNGLLIEVERQRDRADADRALVKSLSTAGNGLGKRLVALTEAILAAADEHGLRDDAGDA